MINCTSTPPSILCGRVKFASAPKGDFELLASSVLPGVGGVESSVLSWSGDLYVSPFLVSLTGCRDGWTSLASWESWSQASHSRAAVWYPFLAVLGWNEGLHTHKASVSPWAGPSALQLLKNYHSK